MIQTSVRQEGLPEKTFQWKAPKIFNKCSLFLDWLKGRKTKKFCLQFSYFADITQL